VTSPVTPAQAESELRRLSHKLEARTDSLADLLVAAAKEDVNYRISHAKALLAADGTVAERDAIAVLAVADELLNRKITEAIADAARESVRSLRDQLSAVQSINANTRYAAGLEQR
jgi:hypothetical protein